MDAIEEEIKRIKAKRKRGYYNNNYKRNKDDSDSRKYVDFLITRVLVSVIIFFVAIILTNTTEFGSKFIKEKVLKEHMSFSNIANVYNKYFGNIVPFEDLVKDDQTVFQEELTYESIENYKDGFELTVKKNYLVPVINSGIVVFIGEKEGLGNTVIIQGVDEIDYWYSNVGNLSCSLYDYVSKGTYLGTAIDTKMYLTFKKGSEYLGFDEIIE